MATAKLTIKRGQTGKDVAVSAGSSISGSDAIELNIDTTKLNRGETTILLEELIRYVRSHGFPPS